MKKYLKKVLTCAKDGQEYTGVCTSMRTVAGGGQVFLQAAGKPGRYFFVKDLRTEKKPAAPKTTPRARGPKFDSN